MIISEGQTYRMKYRFLYYQVNAAISREKHNMWQSENSVHIVWVHLWRSSKTVKGLTFYPTCKLTSHSATFMHAGRRQETPESETKDSLLLSAIMVTRVSIFAPVPPILGKLKKIRHHLLTSWTELQERNPEFREPKPFITGGKPP